MQTNAQQKKIVAKPATKEPVRISSHHKFPLPETKVADDTSHESPQKKRKFIKKIPKKLSYQQLFYITFGASIVFVIFFSFFITKLYSRYNTTAPGEQQQSVVSEPRKLQYLFNDPEKLSNDFTITTLRTEPATWSIGGNALQQTVDGRTNDNKGSIAILKTSPWNSIDLNVLLKSDTEGTIGVIINYSEITGSFYRIKLSKAKSLGGPAFIIEKCSRTQCSVLQRNAFTYTSSFVHALEVKKEGDVLTATIDGGNMLKAKDENSLSPGLIGFYSAGQGNVYFASISINEIPTSYSSSPYNPLIKEK